MPAVVVIFVLIRVGLAGRQGLWADEYFSLAMATGHSLEHPPASANTALGDYVEADTPLPPSAYSRYLQHENPPAGLSRVARAVFLSDTSPIGYYLPLYGWTRLFGTSDLALRSLSIAWALACIPPLIAAARLLGGRRAVVPSLVLFAMAPVSVYYATEGRMYSMLWFFALVTIVLTRELDRPRASPTRVSLWVLASAGGLMTHYFFAFPWLGCVAWLLIWPPRARRLLVLAAAASAFLLVLPWYARVPESASLWRVTGRWLDRGSEPLKIPGPMAKLIWSYVSSGGGFGLRNLLTLAVMAPMVLLLIVRGRDWLDRRKILLWFCLLASLLGPLALDLLRGTRTITVTRYVLGGLPAAYLLLGVGLARLGRSARVALLMVLTATWAPSLGWLYLRESRETDEPFRQMGRSLFDQARSGDLAIIHGIPSSVAGIAREMELRGPAPPGFELASWVGQLGERHVPEDLDAWRAGERRVFLLIIHDVNEPAYEEAWLRSHSRVLRDERLGTARLIVFEPRNPHA